jgi:hypothetical protein
MSDILQSSLRELQAGKSTGSQQAFGHLMSMALRDPENLAAELSRAVRDEHAAGDLRTPRLLTLLGLTRVCAPECLNVCLGMLRGSGGVDSTHACPPSDAVLGAAAIVARSNPRALLPDLAAIVANRQASHEVDRGIVTAIPMLLSLSSLVLSRFGDSAVAGMVRWLWCDYAALDLMTLADFVGKQIEKSNCEDPIVGLFVDLAEQVNATADQKQYAAQTFEAAGASPAVIERLKLAWRAALVAPDRSEIGLEPLSSFDLEPPLPEPRVDEGLAMFSYADEDIIEYGRAMLDEMLEAPRPSDALVYWLTVTVDAMPAQRRKADIEWALTMLGTASRHAKGRVLGVPTSVLQRWLDTPQLLNSMFTLIALELLGAQQTSLVVRHYIHRAIALSDVRHAEIMVGSLWRAIGKAEPRTVLMIVSRWFAFGFDRCEFIELLIKLLADESRANPHLLADLERGLVQTERTPAVVIEVARTALQQLRAEWQETSHP